MARLGRLFDALKKSTGDAALGVSVEVRRQGATVTSNQSSSSSPHAYTVDDPGAIQAGDTVKVGAAGATALTVTAIAANSVTLSFAGTLTLNAGDRLTPTNSLPTLYSDRQGVNTTPNPTFTSTPFGEYEVYLDGGEYDVLASGGGYGTRLFKDVFVNSPRLVMNVFNNSTAKAFILSVRNALTVAGAKMVSIQNADGNEVGFVDKDGNVFINGGIGTAQLADSAVTTVKIADSAVTTVKILDANVTTAKLAANTVHPASNKTLAGSSDVTITTSEVVRATVSYTAATGNVGVLVTVNVPYICTTGGTGKVEVRLYIGGTLKATGVFAVSGQKCIGTVSFTWFEPTAPASATTYEIREIETSYDGGTTGVYKYAGASGYQGYMTLSEQKR